MNDKQQAVTKNPIVKALDANGDGKVDIEDIIIQGMRVPGVRIERDVFLRREFTKNHPESVVNEIIRTNPARAGINPREVDRIADEVIKFERYYVSGISTALGVPGGAAMAVTIPADLAQYYGYLFRAAQKLMYLYGFPQIGTEGENQMLDSETLNTIIVCMGVMFGVQSANTALKSMATALGKGVEKQILKKWFVTRGALYSIVKSIAKWFNVRMTKQIYAGIFKKAIPVAGGVIGGGITFVSFKPCCDRLQKTLQDTYLSNPDYHETEEDKKFCQAIEADFNELD